jgi:hypothetical protein
VGGRKGSEDKLELVGWRDGMDGLVDLRRRGSMLLIRLVLKGLGRLPTKKNKLAATAR